MTRRRAACLVAAGLWLALLAGRGNPAKWHSIDVSGSLPPLSFTMARASDGKETTEADYRGKIVLLYFGLPTARTSARHLVEPGRDPAPPRAGRAAGASAVRHRRSKPRHAGGARRLCQEFRAAIRGAAGTPDQLAALARRYRVVYSVTPATNGRPYEVTHSSAIYVFDGSGAARLIIASLDSTTPTSPARPRIWSAWSTRRSRRVGWPGCGACCDDRSAGGVAHREARGQRAAIGKAQGDRDRSPRAQRHRRRHAHHVIAAGDEGDPAVRRDRTFSTVYTSPTALIDASMQHQHAAAGRARADQGLRRRTRI